MQLNDYVVQVQSQLTNAAALGDDATRATAEALSGATEPAVRLAVLAAVSAAADEITAALLDLPGAPIVSVRIDGDELRIDVRPTQVAESFAEPQTAVGDDTDATARISLRLSESLKSQIESAARNNATSVNNWIVRVASLALSDPTPRGWGRPRGTGTTHHVSGWING